MPISAAKFTDLGLRLAHRGHCEPQLGRCHLVRPASAAATGAGSGQAGFGSLDDEATLEFSQASKHTEYQFAIGRSGIHACPCPARTLKPMPALRQIVHGIHKMTEITAEAVQLPHDERIAFPQCFQADSKAGPVITLARGCVLIDVVGINAGGKQGITLQVGHLTAIRFAYPNVTDQHSISPCNTRR